MDLFNDYYANMTNVISVLAQAQIGRYILTFK